MLNATAIALCLLVAYDDNPDLLRLQGEWEMKIQQGDVTIRIVKSVKGNLETVRRYQGEQLIHEHVVEFELIETDSVKLMRWKNGRVTKGPNAGQKMADGQFIYRLEGDQWLSVFGFLKGEQRPPGIEAFSRVKTDAA